MELAVLLSLAASLCTATASVCQRLGASQVSARQVSARPAGNPAGRDPPGFDLWLVFRLARQPAWLVGFCCMIGGFAFQVSALHFGPLALVQPILVTELLLVFGFLALRAGWQRTEESGATASGTGPGGAGSNGASRSGASRSRASRSRARWNRVGWRGWAAVIAMPAGVSVFLSAAAPSGGREHAPAQSWWLAGLISLAAVAAPAALAGGPRWRRSPVRRAAALGVAAGVGWGFVAAVIKELSAHLTDGPAAIFGTWSPYALAVTGAAAMLLASHAMTAGPLAASQPGFTIGDPVTAIVLGVFLFGERLGASAADLTAEVLGLTVLAAGVWALSGSRLITDTAPPEPGPATIRRGGSP